MVMECVMTNQAWLVHRECVLLLMPNTCTTAQESENVGFVCIFNLPILTFKCWPMKSSQCCSHKTNVCRHVPGIESVTQKRAETGCSNYQHPRHLPDEML